MQIILSIFSSLYLPIALSTVDSVLYAELLGNNIPSVSFSYYYIGKVITKSKNSISYILGNVPILVG